MGKLAYRMLLMLSVLTVTVVMRAQSRVEMVNGDTVHVFNCPSSHGTLIHFHNYAMAAFDGWAKIRTFGDTVSAMLNFHGGGIDTLEGYLRIWDGDSATGILLLENLTDLTLPRNTELYASSGLMSLHLHYDMPSVPQFHNLRLDWEAVNRTLGRDCQHQINSAHVLEAGSTEADITWESNSNWMMIIYGDTRMLVEGNSAHLTGLTPNSTNIVLLVSEADSPQLCCADTLFIHTGLSPCIGCPDFTDFESSYVRFYTGTFNNPYMDIGLVPNRHTIHTNPNEKDLNSNNQLHTVYPGCDATVRLGNSEVGGQAESISYLLHVDTMFYSILLLRYAAVLQNPNHDISAQPRFTLEIMDESNQMIDPLCGVADFAANDDLGWNEDLPGILWKDWTTVGFDLTPYHGRNIFVRFTTYDCGAGGHFGYAYFTADCTRKVVEAEYCGDVDTNAITAPEGFHYRWYYTHPADYFSTERRLSYNTHEGHVYCDLISTENPACSVTMNAYLGTRQPIAIIDTLYCTNRGCSGYDVMFINRSTIGNNGVPAGTNEGCETALWDFGDGFTTTAYSTMHTYHDTGTFTVRLIAGIADDQCLDTTYFTITVPDHYIEMVDSITVCDSVRWRDGNVYCNDTTNPTFRTTHRRGQCDTVFTLALEVIHSKNTILPVDTFCYNERYTWHGQSVGDGGEELEEPMHFKLTDRIPIFDMCDSVVIQPLVQLPPDTLQIEYEADCGEAKYHLKAITDMPNISWTSSPLDTLLEDQTRNKEVLVMPHRTTLYSATSERGISPSCPTTRSITLLPVTFPQAGIKVSPEFLYYGQTEVVAYDHSQDHSNRWWRVVEHSGGFHDTVQLPDTGQHIHYTAAFTLDSLTVLLTVGNDLCLNSTWVTLPFHKTALFAPNAFTPGGSTNRRFVILGHGVMEAEISVFNRQGLLVYISNDIEEGWDGTHNGTPCPQAAYVWLLRYRGEDHPDEWHTMKGTVTLLR